VSLALPTAPARFRVELRLFSFMNDPTTTPPDSDPTEWDDPDSQRGWHDGEMRSSDESEESLRPVVYEERPDGGDDFDREEDDENEVEAHTAKHAARSAKAATGSGSASPPSPPSDPDAEPAPELSWYVLKVQSSREDSIREAMLKRVRIQGLERFFGDVVVPKRKEVEIRNNKKKIVERKTYPGYLLVQMELNERTWFTIRETPGVGDFVGPPGSPTKISPAEVQQILGTPSADEKVGIEEASAEPVKPKIDFERGDRVKIKDGPFENFEGTVEEVVPARGVVKVMIVIFNRPTPVDLEYWQIERI